MGVRRGGRGVLAEVQKRGRDGSPSYGVALEPGEFVVSHSAGGGRMARPSSATRAAFCTICARAGLPPSARGRCMAL